ncbi:MAG: hypothetical protein US49_C0001G0005 [candidate division TM6 bacterium GW2011_GWF2_37_49]|nr:MAG: hypothetical protein US49_C0001G0005 [candidate division TM6 bacterium GW2011_GWF2_37_49]
MRIWIIGVFIVSMFVNTLNGAARSHVDESYAVGQYGLAYAGIPQGSIILDSGICSRQHIPDKFYWKCFDNKLFWVCKIKQSDSYLYYVYDIATSAFKWIFNATDFQYQRITVQIVSDNYQFCLIKKGNGFALRNLTTNQDLYFSSCIKSAFFSYDSKFWVCLEEILDQVDTHNLAYNPSDIRYKHHLKIKLFDLNSGELIFEDDCGLINVVDPKFSNDGRKLAYLKGVNTTSSTINVYDIQSHNNLNQQILLECDVMAFLFNYNNCEIWATSYVQKHDMLLSNHFTIKT